MGSERGYHLHLADAGRSVQKFPITAPVLGTWICYYRNVWNSRNDVAVWCQTTFWNTGTKNKYGSLLYKKQKGKKSTLFVGNKKTKRNMRLAVKKQAPTPLDTYSTGKSSGGATNRRSDSGSYRQFSFQQLKQGSNDDGKDNVHKELALHVNKYARTLHFYIIIIFLRV